jgi:hypothetical protein
MPEKLVLKNTKLGGVKSSRQVTKNESNVT